VHTTGKSRWATLDIEVLNDRGETVAAGEAMVEFPTHS
jgi:3-hydroxybutyryl-CoA dehydratase